MRLTQRQRDRLKELALEARRADFNLGLRMGGNASDPYLDADERKSAEAWERFVAYLNEA